MLKVNDFDRDGCRKNIHRAVSLPKDEKFFLFDRIISEKKIASSETLRWPMLYLFPCSGNPWTILKPLHRQFFLPASIPAQIIFLISSNPYINNLCSAAFIFQLSHSPCFKSSINHLSYWSSSLYRQSFLPASVPRQAILGINFSFFSFYSAEDLQFEVHDYQLLLFIYVING